MPEEKQTVTGEVGKVIQWNSKKGYFLNIKGMEQDFYGFGTPKVKEGQAVTFEVSPGTGQFEDKVCLGKLLKQPSTLDIVKEKAKADMEIVNKSIESGERTYFDKQNLIVRQTCMKAAATVVAGIHSKDEVNSWNDIANQVNEVADRLYAWVTESDLRLPEPEEEP